MQLTFSNFVYDNGINELYFAGNKINLTKQHKDLLLYFLHNSDRIVTKNELIEHIWHGRIVTSNTIDQSISKLKKILNHYKQIDYFATIYGQGIKFHPQVSVLNNAKKNNGATLITCGFIVVVTIMGFYLYLLKTPIEESKSSQKQQILLVISNQHNNKWFGESSRLLITQLLTFTNSASFIATKDELTMQNLPNYLNHQWQMSVLLNTAMIEITKDNNGYKGLFNFTNINQKTKSSMFQHTNIAQVLVQGTQWLQQQLYQKKGEAQNVESLLPEDPYIVELYLRGLNAFFNKEYVSASYFFELCIKEDTGFHMARLALAKLKNKQGQLTESLILLDALVLVNSLPILTITRESMRGNIYQQQGQSERAQNIYFHVLEKYQGTHLSKLNEVRYNLSNSYSVSAKYDLALAQLNAIINDAPQIYNHDLLANVYHRKGHLLQRLGHPQTAKESANKALDLFSQNNELPGVAKAHSLLATIANQQTDYPEAKSQLEHVLTINRSLKDQAKIASTLNKLIHVLITQSQYNKAWKLNQEIEQIAIKTDSQPMLIEAKQQAIKLAIEQRKWQVASTYLQQHRQLSIENSDEKSLLENNLLNLDFLLKQGIVAGTQSLIYELQMSLSNSTSVRLQLRIKQGLAQLYFLIDKPQEALSLLSSLKLLAKSRSETEAIININNLITNYYLSINNPQKALNTLQQLKLYHPPDYPYLLYKSKAYFMLNKPMKALEFASQCKLQALDLWTSDDEAYLTNIAKDVNYSDNL